MEHELFVLFITANAQQISQKQYPQQSKTVKIWNKLSYWEIFFLRSLDLLETQLL